MSRYKISGPGAVAVEVPWYKDMPHKVNEMRFNLSTGSAATAATTMVLDMVCTDSTFNTILQTQAMFDVCDLVWRPDPPPSFGPHDKFRITWANDAASFKKWGLEVIYDE